MNLKTVEMKAFVPAREMAVSKAFYTAIGFAIPWSGDDLAFVHHGDTSFLLQRFYVPEHAANFMMHLLVEDADAWHAQVQASGVVERFDVRLGAAEDRPWAIRDFTLTDPAGVLWRIGHNLPRAASSRPRLDYLAPVLRVADLHRALACYRDRLGFRVEFVHAGFYAGLERDGCRIHLKQAPPCDVGEAGDEPEIDVCLGTGNAQGLQAQMEDQGAPISLPLRSMPYGREFQVRDPDRHVLAFVEAAAGAS